MQAEVDNQKSASKHGSGPTPTGSLPSGVIKNQGRIEG